MVQVGSSNSPVSQELITAARKALKNDGKLQGKEERHALTTAARSADGQISDADKQFLKGLENGVSGQLIDSLRQGRAEGSLSFDFDDFSPPGSVASQVRQEASALQGHASKPEAIEGGAVYGPGSAGSVASKFLTPSAQARTDEELAQPVNLSDKATCLASVNKMSQLGKSLNRIQQNSCGATCIVAASVLDGKEGMNKLMRVIEARGEVSSVNPEDWKAMKEIKDKIANNTLTQLDMLLVQRVVHCQLRFLEGKEDDTSTIKLSAMQQYVNTGIDRPGLFKGVDRPLLDVLANKNIKLIDTDLDGESPHGTKYDHYTLFFNDAGTNAETHVFDPWSTQTGNHITQDVGPYHHGVNASVK